MLMSLLLATILLISAVAIGFYLVFLGLHLRKRSPAFGLTHAALALSGIIVLFIEIFTGPIDKLNNIAALFLRHIDFLMFRGSLYILSGFVMRTISAKADDVKRDWFLIDAEDKTLGRIATEIAHRLRGKHKAIFTPHVDTGGDCPRRSRSAARLRPLLRRCPELRPARQPAALGQRDRRSDRPRRRRNHLAQLHAERRINRGAVDRTGYAAPLSTG